MMADLENVEAVADSVETSEAVEEMVIEEVVEAEVVDLIEIEIVTAMIIEADLEETLKVVEIDGPKITIIREALVEENGHHHPVIIRRALQVLGGHLLIAIIAPITNLPEPGGNQVQRLSFKEVVMTLNHGASQLKIRVLPHGAPMNQSSHKIILAVDGEISINKIRGEALAIGQTTNHPIWSKEVGDNQDKDLIIPAANLISRKDLVEMMIEILREEEEIEEAFVEIERVVEDKDVVEEEEAADLEEEMEEVVDLEGVKEEVVVDMAIVIDLVVVGKGSEIEIGQITDNSEIIIDLSIMRAGEGIVITGEETIAVQ